MNAGNSTKRPEAARRRIQRQAVAVALVSAVALLSLGLLTWSLAREHEVVLQELRATTGVRAAIGELMRAFDDVEDAEVRYALTGDEAHRGDARRAREALSERWDFLRTLAPPSGREATWRALQLAIERRAALDDEIMLLVEQGRADLARAHVLNILDATRSDDLRGAVDQLGEEQARGAASLELRAARTRSQLAAAFVGLLLVTLVLGTYGVVLVRRELGEIDEFAAAMESGERRFRALADGATDLVRIYDRGGQALYVNPASEPLLGHSPAAVLSMRPDELVHEDDRAVFGETVRAASSFAAPSPLVHRMVRADGATRWFATRFEATRLDDGTLENLHLASRDVTDMIEKDRKRARDSARLARLANSDELTGLLNRRGFEEQAVRLLERAQSEQRPVLLAFCDVDGLKLINDQLGHRAGDTALRDAAQLLAASAREADVIARLGGDEFVLLGEVRDADAARAFEGRLRARVQAYNDADERPYRVSVSVGTVICNPADNPTTVQQLLQAGDAAMYEQKRTSRRAATLSGRPIVRSDE